MGSPCARQYDLELRHLARSYGQIRAVDDISLAVEHGEFLSIVGPSGCGKTTTLRMIAGFEQPDTGEIYLEGIWMSRTPPYERNVNTVFQSYALFPHMTVFDNIAFGLRMKRMPRQEIAPRVTRMLEIVELPGYERRHPHQLSGGEQQRVGLARALVNEPTVLLLDEPLGALDLKVRKRMQLELKRIHREVGVTFVYVTHDQEEALVMSDRVAVMNCGRIEQVDTTLNIYERPRTIFVADFIGESNAIAGDVVDCGHERAIRFASGAVVHCRGPQLPVGAPVTVVVRPEKIALGLPGTPLLPDLNCLPGCVQEVTFQGSAVRYIIATDSEQLMVYQQNQLPFTESGFLKPGEEVVVFWRVESTLVFLRQ